MQTRALGPRPKASAGKTSTPSLGIIGGGQLARMLGRSAIQLGCKVVVLEKTGDCPAAATAHHVIEGALSLENIKSLASHCHMITLESDFIDANVLHQAESAGCRVLPASGTVSLIQDKYRQKRTLLDHGLPVMEFINTPTPQAVHQAGEQLGWPLILKSRLGGYDGKGNASVRNPSQIMDSWRKLDGDRRPMYVERFCRFRKELAVIITRSVTGEIVSYPVVETVHRDHICHSVQAPARIDSAIARKASRIAKLAILALNGVGSFGVEMFLDPQNRITINEIACRVHNSGHYTIEACVCSQFENHIRALFGWTLGSTEMVAPAAAMINILGKSNAIPHPSTSLQVPGAHLHWYGKTPVPGRKIGHITVLGKSASKAMEAANKASSSIWKKL
jgi:5-(carboxyamino)imidazole ribonucleotide synthase